MAQTPMQDQKRRAAKAALLRAINDFNVAKEEVGGVAIDFGVKGGELDKNSRAPVNLADGGFYQISETLGKAADKVISSIEALASLSPSADPTRFFGTQEGAQCPLHGTWVNVFTTAADATFSNNTKRGDASVSNTVDAVKGRVWNCIDFLPSVEGPSSPVKQLRVRLSATATSATRIELVFRFVKVSFGRGRTLTIPVPGPFLTRLLFLFQRSKEPPPAYFEILYLDDTLRIHRTGQGAYFVQERPAWGDI